MSFTQIANLGKSAQVDSAALESALRARISGEVRFDRGHRALYATDGSSYRQVPIGVVYPRNADDVIAIHATAREFGAPILCRGAGTSLAGQCCNVAVVMDFSRHMNAILEIDPERRIARVQPGAILDHLRDAAERYGLTFGPDPATHDRCTLGGMIGNNSCGVHSVMAGKTDDNIEELEVLTYDGLRLQVGATSEGELARIIGGGGRRGEVYGELRSLRDKYAELIRTRYPNIPRRVSGFNLNYLLPENGFHVARALVGSEGTCVTTLQATCRLVESPPQRILLVVSYSDIYRAADHVPDIMAHRPIGLEGIDDLLVEYTRRKGINREGLALLPEGGGWLLTEFGGATIEEAEAQARELMAHLSAGPTAPNLRLYAGAQLKAVWQVRESSLGAISHVPGEPLSWEGWEDSAVAPEHLGRYLRDLRGLMNSFDYRGTLYGHFGHACVHTRMNFDMQSAEGIRKYRDFVERAADLVVRYGGSLSGEHGDGQSRAELLPKMFGPELVQAFSEFKAIWDPEWKMNPGKLVEPYRLDENLRLGAHYSPWEPPTHFQFPEDHGSLAHATLRCVGVGKCRREEGGLMCPSYQVTREEEHSTRGRAHLLWEMAQGDPIRDGWRDEAVKESLDLCLACKGCKSDCPVAVDVATYKAEFLSHYYEGLIRPRSAYAFAHIDLWARALTQIPGLANLVTQLPWLSAAAKLAAGMPQARTIPAVAPENFRRWFVRRRARVTRGKRVLLWPDTFNNYFHPQTAQAAVRVLEAAGCEVALPKRVLCCGRPLYDWGLLARAKRLLVQTFDTLADELEAGTPIVVLEPSCASVFRDEAHNLFPLDNRAHRLAAQTFLLSEFLERHAAGLPLPQVTRTALVHGHCHHKSILKMNDEEAVLRRMGIDYSMPAPGCCGMAGGFGFEKGKYQVACAVGELDLLPAVRDASPETLIIADGFSCREQIAQGTARHALHLAEVIDLGLAGKAANLQIERDRARAQRTQVNRSMWQAGLLAAVVTAGTLTFLGKRRPG